MLIYANQSLLIGFTWLHHKHTYITLCVMMWLLSWQGNEALLAIVLSCCQGRKLHWTKLPLTHASTWLIQTYYNTLLIARFVNFSNNDASRGGPHVDFQIKTLSWYKIHYVMCKMLVPTTCWLMKIFHTFKFSGKYQDWACESQKWVHVGCTWGDLSRCFQRQKWLV